MNHFNERMYRLQNARIMHKILIIFCSCLSFVSVAQVENSNMMNPETPKMEVEEKEQLDSLSIYEGNDYKIETVTTKRSTESKKGAKAAEVQKAKSVSVDQAPVPAGVDANQSQEYQQASYGFSYSKQQAATQRTQRSPNEEQQQQMDEAVTYFESNSPNTFECNYFKYVAGNYDTELVGYLEKAEELRPNNTDVQVQMAAYHMIVGNIEEGVQYIDKLLAAKRLDNAVLDYSKDLLISAPDNGMLITHGFDDSYGTWYVQNKQNVRSDVRLVSLDFMQSGTYRQELKEDGFVVPVRDQIDVTYLEELCEANEDKDIAISLTTPKEYFEPIKENLYVSGLTFEYRSEAVDNFSRNEDLWNNDMEKHLVTDATGDKAKQLSANYLPMLLQLRKVYMTSGQEEKVKEIDSVIDKLSAQSNKYEQVQKLKKAY